ncbi:hypothetical protein CI238_13010 [Colletotrichum incanum]|uniref:PiggyBac transposable element-derived protein domain-containing protein n=1 Tax=Colletotrichum incanum TaxID=1573173 RepID=A0A161XSL2_COLIC|nr:hypothetical protein CI238_13010 [Colletotrichum incanum]
MSSSDSDASDAFGASGASGSSVRSCIVVAIRPEDLAAACTTDCTPERCDNSTVRPHEPPAEPGPPGSFIPFDVPARAREIRDIELPAAPLDLFLRLYPGIASKYCSGGSLEGLPGPAQAQAQAEARMPDVYRKVNEWSAYIQETGDSFYTAGSDLTVDEAMVRFTGRSQETTTIPTKPIPTGFKIWILA